MHSFHIAMLLDLRRTEAVQQLVPHQISDWDEKTRMKNLVENSFDGGGELRYLVRSHFRDSVDKKRTFSMLGSSQAKSVELAWLKSD